MGQVLHYKYHPKYLDGSTQMVTLRRAVHITNDIMHFFSTKTLPVLLTSLASFAAASQSEKFKLKLVPSESAPFYGSDDYNLVVNADDEKLYVKISADYITGYIDGDNDNNLYDYSDGYEIGVGKNYFSEISYSSSFYYPGLFTIADGLLNFNGSSVFHAVYSSVLADGVYAFGTENATGVAKTYYEVSIAAVDPDTGVAVADFA